MKLKIERSSSHHEEKSVGNDNIVDGGDDDDDDVAAEKRRVAESTSVDDDVLTIDALTKVFGSFPRRQKVVAVDGVTLGIHRGEVKHHSLTHHDTFDPSSWYLNGTGYSDQFFKKVCNWEKPLKTTKYTVIT